MIIDIKSINLELTVNGLIGMKILIRMKLLQINYKPKKSSLKPWIPLDITSYYTKVS